MGYRTKMSIARKYMTPYVVVMARLMGMLVKQGVQELKRIHKELVEEETVVFRKNLIV